MRIILAATCSFPNGPTGGPRMVGLMARGFADLGHEVITATMRGTWDGVKEKTFGPITSICSNNTAQNSEEENRLSRRILNRIAFLCMLLGILFRRKPDVFVFYGPTMEYLFVLLAIWLFHPCRTCYLNADDCSSSADMPRRMRIRLSIWRFAERMLCRHCSSILIIGTTLYEERMRRLAPTTPLIRGRGAPVDAAAFSSGDGNRFRNAYKISWKRLVIYAGTIHFNEGCAVLLNAFSTLRKIRKDVGLVLVGKTVHFDTGHGTVDYKVMAERLGIADVVYFTGHISPEYVTDALAAADVLVLPKIDHPSNRIAFPIKIGEYLASGRPVVCSQLCDIDQYASDRQQLLFVAPGNEKELTEAMNCVLDDPLLAKTVGTGGKRLAEETFDYRQWFAHVAPVVLGLKTS